MSFNNKVIYYISIFIYLLVIYRNSWLPGGKFFIHKEYYIFNIAFIVLLVLLFDFYIIEKRIDFGKWEPKLFSILSLQLILSYLFFNLNELKSPYFMSQNMSFISYFFMFFIFLPRFLVDNKIYFRYLVQFFSYFSFVFSFIGVFLFFKGVNPVPRFHSILLSILVHPNLIAPVCVIGILSTVYLYLSFKKETFNVFKLFLISSFFIQFLALLLSFSRTGIISILISLLFFFIIAYRQKVLIYIPIVILIVPAFILGFIKAKGFASFLSRFYLLIPAYYMLISDKIRLLMGYGVSNSYKVYGNYKILYGVFEDVNNPHDAYLTYIMMYGLIFSSIFFLIILIIVVKGFVRSLKVSSNARLYYAFIISVIVCYLVQGLFESPLAMTEYSLMQPFLTFLGLLYISEKKSVKTDFFINCERI